MTEPQEQDEHPWRSGPYLPWALGGLPFAVAVLRILAATSFDPLGATTVIAHADVTKMLLEALLVVVPAVLLIGTPFLWMWRSQQTDWSKRYMSLVAASILTMFIVTAFPWPYLATGGLIAIALATRRRLWRPPPLPPHAWVQMAAGFAIPTVIVAFLLYGPGLATEVITHGRQTSTGHVIREDGEWTTFLRRSDQAVLIINSETITRRVVCRPPGQSAHPSLLNLVNRERTTVYPTCPR